MRRFLLTLTLLAVGCAGPVVDLDDLDDLVLVTVDPVPEEGLPELFRLVLRARPLIDPVGPVHLQLPLPPERITTMLAWDVSPPAEADMRGRVLHVTSPEGFPDVVVRAVIELPSGSAVPDLREIVSGPASAEAGGRPLEVTLEGSVR